MKSIDGSESDHQILKRKKFQPTSISTHTIPSNIDWNCFSKRFLIGKKIYIFSLFVLSVSLSSWMASDEMVPVFRDERAHTLARMFLSITEQWIEWKWHWILCMYIFVCISNNFRFGIPMKVSAENIHTRLRARTYAYAPNESSSIAVSGSKVEKDF